MAIKKATKEAVYMSFLGQMLEEWKLTVLYSDILGAHKVACNLVFHCSAKQADIHNHFTYEAVQD
jgi:hypothetical protein